MDRQRILTLPEKLLRAPGKTMPLCPHLSVTNKMPVSPQIRDTNVLRIDDPGVIMDKGRVSKIRKKRAQEIFFFNYPRIFERQRGGRYRRDGHEGA